MFLNPENKTALPATAAGGETAKAPPDKPALQVSPPTSAAFQAVIPPRSAAGPAARPPIRRWSLAARLTAWYALSAFGLILLATSLMYVVLAASFEAESDRYLADRLGDVKAILDGNAGFLSRVGEELDEESSARRYLPVFFRINDERGQVIAESPNLPKVFDTRLRQRQTVFDADGQPYRLLTATIRREIDQTHEYTIQAAVSVVVQQKLLEAYRSRMWIALSISMVGCLLAGYLIARSGIRPVQEVSNTARRIRSTALDERIDSRHMPAELALLANEFNEMLDRLKDGFERLSRFSADIAHELRTPVNNVRGAMEVALGKPRTSDEYRETLASCTEEAQRLTRIIESLLFLARAEDPNHRIRREPLEVARELTLVREFYDAMAAEAGVRIDVDAQPPLLVPLDRTLFQRALGNLVANAIAHTPSGGRVTLSAARANGSLQVDVTDTGCGVSDEHLPRVFDRLFRVDPDRSSVTGGAGLGLAIVKSIATSHGGTATFRSRAGHGTCVSLSFPIDAPTSPSPA
jgi:two-component system heavy metal sensor histidine kinase CusS